MTYVQRELPFVPSAPAREVLTAAEEAAVAIARANAIARELLEMQGTADEEEAFAGALHFLMRAADVGDTYPPSSVRPRVALVALIERFGIEKVRDWTRQIGAESQFRARLPSGRPA